MERRSIPGENSKTFRLGSARTFRMAGFLTAKKKATTADTRINRSVHPRKFRRDIFDRSTHARHAFIMQVRRVSFREPRAGNSGSSPALPECNP
jgi:hypothetical protein